MEKNNYEFIFNNINDWIKTADQKAAIFVAFDIINIIYSVININKNNINLFYIILLILFFQSSILSLFFLIKIIYPRLNNKSYGSLIFFQDIANKYENNIEDGALKIEKLTDEEYIKDLSKQIIYNSKVAKNKYKNIKIFVIFFCIQLILSIVILLMK